MNDKEIREQQINELAKLFVKQYGYFCFFCDMDLEESKYKGKWYLVSMKKEEKSYKRNGFRYFPSKNISIPILICPKCKRRKIIIQNVFSFINPILSIILSLIITTTIFSIILIPFSNLSENTELIIALIGFMFGFGLMNILRQTLTNFFAKSIQGSNGSICDIPIIKKFIEEGWYIN